jgi:hypothetical protein
MLQKLFVFIFIVSHIRAEVLQHILAKPLLETCALMLAIYASLKLHVYVENAKFCIMKVKKYDTRSGDDEKKGKRPLPYMPLVLHDPTIMADAVSLVEHHMRRQAGLQPEDKTRIYHIVSKVLPRLLNFQPPSNAGLGDTYESRDANGKAFILYV